VVFFFLSFAVVGGENDDVDSISDSGDGGF